MSLKGYKTFAQDSMFYSDVAGCKILIDKTVNKRESIINNFHFYLM